MFSQRTFEAGNVWLTVEYRHFGGDEGYDIRVYSQVHGNPRQILRFDCFKYQPHYHYDPLGRDERIELAGYGIADAILWTLKQLNHHLPEMLTQAGYADVAAQVQPEAVREAVAKLEEHLAMKLLQG
ncbi:MAG: hypothetical protein RMM08_05200 [Armatimonadota bacterium]|nr:hypothetical protein [bacterium]MDW8320737.1 hypothetical protein [Armatimonadota bacterium]